MEFTVIANLTAPHQITHQAALVKGLSTLGVKANLSHSNKSKTEFVACWGWRIGKQLRDQGHQVLVMERGYLGDRFGWTSLAWNGLNGFGEFPEYADDNGARFHANFKMQPWREAEGEYVLIMGQVPGDASLRGRNLVPWYEGVATLAADAYKAPVRFRAHPVAEQRGLTQSPRHCTKSFGSLEEAVQNAKVVITYNSNSAVDSVIAGVPTVAMDEGSMAWGVTSHTIGGAEMPDREKWANNLAWKQWRMCEIESGFALKKLLGLKNS